MDEQTSLLADSPNALGAMRGPDSEEGRRHAVCPSQTEGISSRPEWPAPPGRTFLLVLAAFLLSLGGTWWLASSVSRSLTGILQTRRIPITADRAGRIQEIATVEGESVTPGDTVLLLADRSRKTELRAQRRRVAELKARLEQAHSEADVEIAWRMKELQQEILETKLQSAGYLKSQFDDQVQREAWADMASGGVVQPGGAAPDSVFQSLGAFGSIALNDEVRVRALLKQQAAENASEVSAVQIRLCDERLQELQALQAELPDKIRRAAGVDDAQSQLASAREQLRQLEAQPPVVALKSDAYGTVGVYRKQVGEAVHQGEPIVELLDEARRFLLVPIPTEHLNGLTEGTPVELIFPGGQERTGTVGAIPPQTILSVHGDARAGWERSEAPEMVERWRPFGPATAALVGENRQRPAVSVRIRPTGKIWPKVPLGTCVEVIIPH